MDSRKPASPGIRKEGVTAEPWVDSSFPIDSAVLRALPIPGTKLIAAFNYGTSLWTRTMKLICLLPSGEKVNYFLKVNPLGELAKQMCAGEYESMKALHAASPIFCTKPYGWGPMSEAEPGTYFVLSDFRDVGEQPPEPIRFTARLAEMHRVSTSPTGKFGFHTTTCHATVPQITDCWDEWWYRLYQKQFRHMVELDLEKNGAWPEFQILCDLTLDKVIPRLLKVLQTEGRSIKPCLLHGDLWDENAAIDTNTGEPFVFAAACFYGHNEYDIGNWRTPRHRLSNKTYLRQYKRRFPVSEPEDEWDARNLLYSLCYELHAAVIFPGSNLRQVVFDGMTDLCQQYFPRELGDAQEAFMRSSSNFIDSTEPSGLLTRDGLDDEEGEEEEEEEEEEEKEEEEAEEEDNDINKNHEDN